MAGDRERPGRPGHVRGDPDHDQDSEAPGVFDVQLPRPGLSGAEKKNLMWLFGLYFIHAIPLQFSWASMPVLLRQEVGYSDVGNFIISQYPYSWKVLWSPVVEAFYIRALGRRKSWIVPCFILAGAVVFALALSQDGLVARVARGETSAMTLLVLAWLPVMVLCANIRIALDSWALDLLSQPNVHWASPAVTVAETAAGFMSFNLFLGLSPPETSKDGGGGDHVPTDTTAFYTMTAIALVVTALVLLIWKKEKDTTVKRTLSGSYAVIWKIMTLPQVWTLMLVHMASMIGFMTCDTIAVLQLVKSGFTGRDIAVLATVSFPFEVVCGVMVSRAFQTRHPLYVWRKLFPWRLLAAFVSQFAILFVFAYHNSPYRWVVVFVPLCISKLFETAMFVSLVAFHAQVSDPLYGGIYLSLLSITLNIRYDILGYIFTELIGFLDRGEDLKAPSRLIDGFQIVNAASVLLAIPVFWFFLRPATIYLQTIDPSAWRVGDIDRTSPVSYELVGTTDEDELDDI